MAAPGQRASLSVRGVVGHHCGNRILPTDDSACIQVVFPSTLAQVVERYMAFGVARKHE